MTDMALIVPSRGRPDNITRLYKALGDTKANVNLYVGVDGDDPELEQYEKLARNDLAICVSNKRKRFGETLNYIACDISPEYDFIAWMGDDHLPITDHWDQAYKTELKQMGTGIVYGNDLVMGEQIPTQLAMTSDIVKKLGYAVPAGFIHLYIDNYFLELGKACGRIKYLPDVIVQHLHYSAGKSEEDQTYREANSPENWSHDRVRFEKYMREELHADVQKLGKVS